MNPIPLYYNGKVKCDEALEVVLDDPIAYSRIDILKASKYNTLVFWIGQIFRYVWRVFGKDTPEFNLQKIVVCAVKALRLLLPEEEVDDFLFSLFSEDKQQAELSVEEELAATK
jgi:hypothetical protein